MSNPKDVIQLVGAPPSTAGSNLSPVLEELRRELTLKSAMLQVSADPIFVLNRDGTIFESNLAVRQVFGYSPQNLAGRDFAEKIISPICQESFRLSFDRLATTESGPLLNRTIELSAVRSDFTEISVELTLKSLRIEDCSHFVAYVRDVSESRKTESLLRESESRFRKIFDSNMTGIFFWDFQGNIFDANDALLKL